MWYYTVLGYISRALDFTLRLYLIISLSFIVLVLLLSFALVFGGLLGKYRYYFTFAIIVFSAAGSAIILIPFSMLRHRNVLNAPLLLIVLAVLLSYGSVVGTKSGKFRYYCNVVLVGLSIFAGVFIVFPIAALRPRNVINNLYAMWIARIVTGVVDITMEIRNSEYLEADGGALVCMNHQSLIDSYVCAQLSPILKRWSAMYKKEHLYLFPYGPALWLCGIYFVDRKSPKTAYRTLKACEEKLISDKVKLIIFPEGTRNKTRGFLPFKKGAFKTAISAQLPIIPVVISPYYFVDNQNQRLDKGHMIVKALPPIVTTGLTDEDMEVLMEKTRIAMLAEYEKLGEEVDRMSQIEEWRDEERPRVLLG